MDHKYSCILAPVPRTNCTISRHDVTGTTGVITTRGIRKYCGSHKSLTIIAKDGQRIQVILHGVSSPGAAANPTSVPQGSPLCNLYGYIVEWDGSRQLPICGDAYGKTTVLTSLSSAIHVNISQSSVHDALLVQYTCEYMRISRTYTS
jgi:hypothetical protein